MKYSSTNGKRKNEDYKSFMQYNAVELNNTPHSLKDMHVLIPRTCEYITLSANRDFADVIKNLEKETG